MAIPVITIPSQGKILARPRFEALYDTEGWDDGNTIGSLTIYKNSSAFANTNLGLTKTKGRDVNLDAVSGLAVGQSFQWYAFSLKVRPMNQTVAADNTGVTFFDVLRRIRETNWITFYLMQQTIYFTEQMVDIPACVENKFFSTANQATMIGSAMDQARDVCKDVTIMDAPVEFGPLENWTVLINSSYPSGTSITPAYDIYVSPQMKGILLRGIQG